MRKAQENLKKTDMTVVFDKIRKVVGWSLMVLLPVVAFFLVEAYWHNPFAEVRIQAKWMNILIYELIAWIFLFLTGRSKWALRLLWGLALVYGLTNYYVMEFRSTPFVPWDLFSVKTAASVAGNYDFTPSVKVAVLSLIFIAGIVLVGFADVRLYGVRPRGESLWSRCRKGVTRLFAGRGMKAAKSGAGLKSESGEKTRDAGETRQSQDKASGFRRWIWMWRLVPAVLLTLILTSFVGLLQKEDFQLEHDLYPYLFTPTVMNKYNGFAVTFAMDLAYVVVEKPAGYRASEEQKKLQEYDQRAKGQESAKQASAQDLPNVIVIMNEAFSDLGVLGDHFQTDPDCLPFVHRLLQGQENTVTGMLNVSVCGGNTANTEFEFLTGNSMAFFPVGSIPYQQYIKKPLPSLASHLKSLGYATTAVHPYNASGWSRDTVYPLLGFDRFDSLNDFSSVSYFRDYVTDESDYDKIKEIYQAGKNEKPQFIFNVTMQNHGSYSELFDNFVPDVSSNAGTGTALHQYLSLIRQSDLAFENLVDYFSKESDKTVLVFFGDHQPADFVAHDVWQVNGVNDANLTDEQRQIRYQVPYVIWANFPIEQAKGQDTSVNYLAQRVLQSAGIPLSGYQMYLSEKEKEVPVISAVRREGDEKKILEYQKMQYYQMFDREE